MFIVELEPNKVWLADGDGDPPRTLVESNARVFSTRESALVALLESRQHRSFCNADTINIAIREKTVDISKAITELFNTQSATQREIDKELQILLKFIQGLRDLISK